MQIDRASLEKLLSMNDRQLMLVIERLAANSGIDPATLGIDPKNVQSIRHALRTTSDEELGQIVAQYEANKKRRG